MTDRKLAIKFYKERYRGDYVAFFMNDLIDELVEFIEYKHNYINKEEMHVE